MCVHTFLCESWEPLRIMSHVHCCSLIMTGSSIMLNERTPKPLCLQSKAFKEHYCCPSLHLSLPVKNGEELRFSSLSYWEEGRNSDKSLKVQDPRPRSYCWGGKDTYKIPLASLDSGTPGGRVAEPCLGVPGTFLGLLAEAPPAPSRWTPHS